ncbi:MAG: excinuclease ABC subunit UvrA [Bacilli bacterium]|nr:excinuclease ABC subunit UvrA [Bacilli bacterium]
MSMDKIVIKGARENNLKNIDIEIPKNKLVVMTGVSGSGKSSLAFDTIYAEGQRRYVESLSAYARQFLGGTEKPDVDSIEGLSPSISIDQKTTSKNPRSTVGTVTEIYDYLRLLFARIGIPYCPIHLSPIKSQTVDEIVEKIMSYGEGTKIEVMAPVVRASKGTHKEVLDNLRKSGFTRVRVNGVVYDLSDEIKLEKNKKDIIEVIVDRIVVKEKDRSRLAEAIEASTRMAEGRVLVNIIGDKEVMFSENYACPICDFSLPELEPTMFSFNNPFGACEDCKGLGFKQMINLNLLIPDKSKSVYQGAIKGLSLDSNIMMTEIETCAEHYGIDLSMPIGEMPKSKLDILLYGSPDELSFKYVAKNGNKRSTKDYFEGIVTNLERRYIETNSAWIRDWLELYMMDTECPTCHGARLKENMLAVKVGGKSIYEVCLMSIKDLIPFFEKLKLTKEEAKIAELLLKEITNRLSFLKNVGLEYLTLARTASTLSGGELQRIRLATQIGSRLTGVLYVLDEPSIGLHQRDNDKLINSLLEMRDIGNTLIVVEHDEDTMRAADYLIDIGPSAGEGGGYVVAQGTPKEIEKNRDSLTGRYLAGLEKIEVPKKRRKGNGKYLEIKGAREHNLKNINVKIPLGKFVCVTGVSGSGKSSLVDEIIYKVLMKHVYNSKVEPGIYKSIKGLEHIDKVVQISQDPIGRTPRSNPATYIGLFDDIRDLFAEMKESKIRGFTKSRFSFNVKGGRCEACWGDGVKKIEMHFLPDVYVPCDVCDGKRYNSETLEVKFKGKSIYEVLEMRVGDAIDFFESVPKIRAKLQMLIDVGLSYIKIGQSAPTLSGGEAGRIKLAKELQKKPTGKSVFILDEPTTGLHIDDIKKLLVILNRIVDNGDTVLVIEHNLDVIKVADHIIDLGPEGGDGGGEVIATGTPEEIIKEPRSYTGKYLKKMLEK